MQIVEDELIDEDLAVELAGREREAFEAHFMNAPGRIGLSWVALRISRRSGPRQDLTVMLAPGGVTRGGSNMQEVVIPAGTDMVRLRLRLPADEFRSYDATLLDARGETVFTGEGLKPELAAGGKVIMVNIPARDLPPGGYLLRLGGVRADGDSEPAGSYYFRVASRDGPPPITH